jgi:hypothetical protein
MKDETRAFLLKAIERQPSGRFQTALEFREALEKVLE